MTSLGAIRAGAVAASVFWAGCGSFRMPSGASNPAAAPVPSVLPPLNVEEIAVAASPLQDAGRKKASRVTLSATNADVRDLLQELAIAAGVRMIIAPDVRTRVTVHFVDVDAREALESVIEQAELTLGPTHLVAPYAHPVFRDLAVNVNTASTGTIQARYGVSARIAELVVQGRPE